jgi:TRAP-type uncharacterized transport system fused permease subunit
MGKRMFLTFAAAIAAASIVASAIDSAAAPKSIANVASVDYFTLPVIKTAVQVPTLTEDEIRVVNHSGS